MQGQAPQQGGAGNTGDNIEIGGDPGRRYRGGGIGQGQMQQQGEYYSN